MTEAAERGMGTEGPSEAGEPGEPATSGRGLRWAASFARVLRRFGYSRWLTTALLFALLVLRVWDPQPLETLRLKTFDFYQALQPRALSEQPIAIVDLDEVSLAEIGQWPWPRTVVADLVSQIMRFQAVAVGFDVVFAEPDRASPSAVANTLRGVDESFRVELRSLPDNDIWLANVFRQARVVVGQAGYPRDIGEPDRPVEPPPLAVIGDDPKPYLLHFAGIVRNIPVLEEAAQGRGMFSLNAERDGVVRRVPAIMSVKDAIVPTLALELLRIATGGNAYAIKTDQAGVKSVVVGGVEIPTDRHGRLWVHFSKHDPSKYVSAKDVLRGTLPPGALANKLVLIGTSATGLLDIKTTPVEPVLPGVEVHAQLLEAILAGSLLERPNYALGAELMMAAAVSLVVIALVPVMGAVLTLLLGSALAASLTAASWYLYVEDGILLDVGFALLASLIIYGSLVYINYFREERQKRRVRGAFSQYLSPALVKQLAENPDRLVLGGETKVMSFLFCDVRGFTTISEQYKTDPQGLTTLINRLLTPLTDAILAQNGTVDKYMGDCVMAFWNAPLNDDQHARHACQAALDMLLRLGAVNEERRQESDTESFVDLRVGIGINTGACTVGNMGSDQRFDYSVLGDAVNLASRLEGQSRNYGVPIVIGAATAAEVGEDFALLEMDLIAVKGKHEPERIFALLGDAALGTSDAFQELRRNNAALLACYRAQDWAGAKAALEECRKGGGPLGLDALYALHGERVDRFEAEPPDPEWDGVFVAETK